jgi:hypothetical protein
MARPFLVARLTAARSAVVAEPGFLRIDADSLRGLGLSRRKAAVLVSALELPAAFPGRTPPPIVVTASRQSAAHIAPASPPTRRSGDPLAWGWSLVAEI